MWTRRSVWVWGTVVIGLVMFGLAPGRMIDMAAEQVAVVLATAINVKLY